MKLDDLVSYSPTLAFLSLNISSWLLNVPTAMTGEFDLLSVSEKIGLVGFLVWDKYQQRKDYDKLRQEYKEEEALIRKEMQDIRKEAQDRLDKQYERADKIHESYQKILEAKDKKIEELYAKLYDHARQQTPKT